MSAKREGRSAQGGGTRCACIALTGKGAECDLVGLGSTAAMLAGRAMGLQGYLHTCICLDLGMMINMVSIALNWLHCIALQVTSPLRRRHCCPHLAPSTLLTAPRTAPPPMNSLAPSFPR